MAEFESQFRSYRELVESALDDAIADEPGLNAVMRYAVLGGGKRVRGVLTLTFANGAEAAARLAAAIELLHAYTLVHDDLPCMDDDDMRRGKPSAHKAFGEWQALLAGDALQALAFKLASEVGDGFTAILAEAATAVCAGQYMDLEGNADLHALTRCKTAALFVAACKLGALAADSSPYVAERYGESLGLTFQVRDDILDNDGYVTAFGLTESRRLADSYTALAVDAVSDPFLIWLAKSLASRPA